MKNYVSNDHGQRPACLATTEKPHCYEPETEKHLSVWKSYF